jgi:hypothetical protein
MGVRPIGKVYHAHIAVNKKSIHLGSFETVEAAVAARKQAQMNLGFHPNHGEKR